MFSAEPSAFAAVVRKTGLRSSMSEKCGAENTAAGKSSFSSTVLSKMPQNSIPCAQRDDMEKIYPAYRESDVVVLASPLYYWFISGHLKNAFDRLFAIAECDPNVRNPVKDSVLIMAAEGAGFEESEHWYDHLEKHIGWKSIGKVLCGWVTQPGDIEGKPELKKAYDLGKSIS